MKEVSKEDLVRIQGAYRLKYGIKMDDWSASVLYEIHENFGQLDGSVNRSINQISQAADRIKGTHKSIHFQSKRQAFFFGMGIFVPLAFAMIIFSVSHFWLKSSSQEYERTQRIIDTYENVSDYVLLMQNGKIIEKDGANFLVLEPRPKKGDVRIGKEYVFDHPNKRVLVPLGRK
ncbi:MAG TPA: hypothetical protein VGN64_21850 [Dyadobacter sp.]|jgi:hypothetical protein|nr:hypothetical protein [Dyadobacter sp.]